MQIIIVGCGNVGYTLVEQLSKEGHDVTVIDSENDALRNIVNNFDVMGIVGNGASYMIQLEAGMEQADLMIAVTDSDELNLLCCLIAKKTGNCQTIARVRNPVYSREIEFIKEGMGLSMVINPEYAAAMEMSRILKFPGAMEVDTFAKGKIELVRFKLEEGSILCNLPLHQVASKVKCNVLIGIIEREAGVYIPGGDFILRAKDEISIISSPQNAILFFKKLGLPTTKAKSTMLIGGDETAYYLAHELLSMGIEVKIIEKDKKRCLEMSELLPDALIIHGDVSNRELLLEEGLESTESFVAMTGVDEENIILTLFAKSVTKAKVITKVQRIAFDEIIEGLDMGSVVYPRYITAEYIIKYVRAMNNSLGSNIETLYRLNDNRVEAMEFRIKEGSKVIGEPLSKLNLKPDILIGFIQHKGNNIIPKGNDEIRAGDLVVVITTIAGLLDIDDILK